MELEEWGGGGRREEEREIGEEEQEAPSLCPPPPASGLSWHCIGQQGPVSLFPGAHVTGVASQVQGGTRKMRTVRCLMRTGAGGWTNSVGMWRQSGRTSKKR